MNKTRDEAVCLPYELTNLTSRHIDLLSYIYSFISDEDLKSGFQLTTSILKETKISLIYDQQGFVNEACKEYECALSVFTQKKKTLQEYKQFEEKVCEERLKRCQKMKRSLEVWTDDSEPSSSFLSFKNLLDFTEESSKSLKCFMVCPEDGGVIVKSDDVSNFFIKKWQELSSIFTTKHFYILQAADHIGQLSEAALFHDILHGSLEPDAMDKLNYIFGTWIESTPSVKDDCFFWEDIYNLRRHQLSFLSGILNKTPEENPLYSKSSHESCKRFLETCKKFYFPKINFLLKDRCPFVSKMEKFHQVMDPQLISELEALKSENKQYIFIDEDFNLSTNSELHELNENEILEKLDIFNTLRYKGLSNFSDMLNKENRHGFCELLGNHFFKQFDLSENNDDKKSELGEFAAHFLLSACKYLNQPDAVKLLGKVVWLCSMCDIKFENLQSQVGFYSFPTKLWIPWIPQLITFLQSSYPENSYKILKLVGKEYPQALYFPLHVTVSARGKDESKYCIKLLDHMKSEYPGLFFYLEMFKTELEKLSKKHHRNVLGRLKLFVKQLYEAKYGFMSDVYSKFNTDLTTDWSPVLNDLIHQIQGYGELDDAGIRKLQDEFKTIDPKSTDAVLLKCLDIIKSLECTNNQKYFNLFEVSEFLSTYHHLCIHPSIEIYFNSLKNNIPSKITISKFMNSVQLIQNEYTSGYKLYVKTESGKIVPVILEFGLDYSSCYKENSIYQLFELLNSILKEENPTAKMNLELKTPQLMLLSPTCKLTITKNSESSISLFDIAFWEIKKHLKISRPSSKGISSISEETINKKYVINNQKDLFHSNILKNWAVKLYEPRSYLAFRKQFAVDIALIGIVKYLFLLSKENPEMLTIDLQTGEVAFNSSKFEMSVFQRNNPFEFSRKNIPFRLTPNIRKFISEYGINGYVKNAIISTVCCLQKHEEISCYLKLFLKYFASVPENERKFKEVLSETNIVKVTKTVIQQIEELSGIPSDNEEKGKMNEIGSKVNELIKTASDENNLYNQNPLYFPLF